MSSRPPTPVASSKPKAGAGPKPRQAKGSSMKCTIAPAVILGLALSTTPFQEAQAGLFRANRDRNPSQSGAQRVEMPAESRQPRRFERFPQMEFVTGTLQRDNFSGWSLGGTELIVRADCLMLEGGSPVVVLEEGRSVIVTGAWRDGALEAYGITVQPVIEVTAVADPLVKVKPSDSDPAVGEVISKPY